MFTETLRIKPVLDSGTAASMERSLTARFARVGKRFGAGLKNIVKGTVFGISLGLLTKILNPIQELEEKIKDLLGQGSDIRDQADRFGTTSGKMKRLQDVGRAMGVEPDQLRDLMGKFQKAIEEATQPLKAGETRSAAASAVSEFTGQKDLAEGFFAFIQSLKNANGRTQAEKDVFGETQFGAARRFIEGDFRKALTGIPTAQASGRAVEKVAGMKDRQNRIGAINEAQDFIQTASAMKTNFVDLIEASKQRERVNTNKEIESFEAAKKTQEYVGEIFLLMKDVSKAIVKGVSEITSLAGDIKEIRKSRAWRYVFPEKE